MTPSNHPVVDPGMYYLHDQSDAECRVIYAISKGLLLAVSQPRMLKMWIMADVIDISCNVNAVLNFVDIVFVLCVCV